MSPDVLVIGGGNAALCAALMAREAGASVLLLESAPRAWRGGNSAHTRNLRCMHDAPQDVLVEIEDGPAYRPAALCSLSDDELSPAALAARVVLGDCVRELVQSGRWVGARLTTP